VVLGGTQIPDGAMAAGIPAKIREGKSSQKMIAMGAASYVERGHRFAKDLRRID
jgi:carbonic anhydrase/acetyltransferase-like protein (isoleucine patch superfamily)